jgi:hypothetical protein
MSLAYNWAKQSLILNQSDKGKNDKEKKIRKRNTARMQIQVLPLMQTIGLYIKNIISKIA